METPPPPPSPYLRLGRWRVQAGIILVVTGSRDHHRPHPCHPPTAGVEHAAVGAGEGQQDHRRRAGLSLQRRLDKLQTWEGRDEGQETMAGGGRGGAAGGSRRERVPLRAVG